MGRDRVQVLKFVKLNLDINENSDVGLGCAVINPPVARCAHKLCSLTTLKAWMKEWGLTGTRKQAHTIETIAEPVGFLRAQYPTAGSRQLRDYLRTQYNMRVPRYVRLF